MKIMQEKNKSFDKRALEKILSNPNNSLQVLKSTKIKGNLIHTPLGEKKRFLRKVTKTVRNFFPTSNVVHEGYNY
jgi:hypothetical protein